MIKTSINQSIGYLRNLDTLWYEESLTKSFDFWRFLRLHEASLFEQAETGDLLLCSNKHGFDITKLSVPHHVERVFLLFKVDPDQHPLTEEEQKQGMTQFNVKNNEELHVLRISAEQQGLILEPWSEFK